MSPTARWTSARSAQGLGQVRVDLQGLLGELLGILDLEAEQRGSAFGGEDLGGPRVDGRAPCPSAWTPSARLYFSRSSMPAWYSAGQKFLSFLMASA